MLLGIDHVVLAADDPEAAAAELETKLGLVASGGGRHEALGTFNRLIWLGDAYLELLGVFDRELAAGSWLGRPALEILERDGGLATWAIAVDDLDEALRWGPPSGGLVGPIDGERRRDDERVVRWRLARPEAPSPTEPFVIEHDRAGAEWTDGERAARAEEQHPAGGRVRLAGLEVEAPSPAVAAGRIRKLLAASVEPAGRGVVRIRFGPHEARLAVPAVRTGALVDLVVDVPIRTRTARIGDCQIRLRGTPREVGASPHPEPSPDV
ncbi:MAG TPA: VOC family protein [Candidatus Limnocylindrales bacterium]|nr:VOC family protein [Candidatus Limnocylindrales bacterium]